MGDGCWPVVGLELPELLGPDGTVKEEGLSGLLPLVVVVVVVPAGAPPALAVALLLLLLAVVGIPFERITSLESFPGSGRLQNAFWLTGAAAAPAFVGDDASPSGRFAFFFIGRLEVPGGRERANGNNGREKRKGGASQ